jgi:hypothetical protein
VLNVLSWQRAVYASLPRSSNIHNVSDVGTSEDEDDASDVEPIPNGVRAAARAARQAVVDNQEDQCEGQENDEEEQRGRSPPESAEEPDEDDLYS